MNILIYHIFITFQGYERLVAIALFYEEDFYISPQPQSLKCLLIGIHYTNAL